MSISGRSWTIWTCPDCGATNVHANTCGMFPGAPVEHGTERSLSRRATSRGPQSIATRDRAALKKIGDDKPGGIRMSAEMAYWTTRGPLDLDGGQQAVAGIGDPANDCPHPAWDHFAEACVACDAAPTRAVVERDQEITDLEAQLAGAVQENENLRAEVDRLNGLLIAQGKSWEPKLATAEKHARDGQPVLGDIEPT